MRKLALIVLDGWGVGKEDKSNAIFMANTPFFKRIDKEYPRTQLQASHEYVGLPHGQLGGSEVGHLTIGAGRIFFQDLPRVSRSLNDPNNSEFGILRSNTFQHFLTEAKAHTAHLIGMISPGGIHSHQDHLYKLLEIMKEQGCKSPLIHFISDGRDTLPNVGINFAKMLLEKISLLEYGRVVDVTGRYYTMDRDKNWERTQKGVDLIVLGKADKEKPDLITAFTDNYSVGLTDELQEATRVDPAYTGIKEKEPLFFFNFRADRMKQPVTKIHEMLPDNPIFTMTQYDETFPYPAIFSKEHLTDTLGEIISKAGITQIRAAETDKIPHVTYFFDGGIDLDLPNEHRLFMESTKVTYDQTPEMRAKEIVDGVSEKLDQAPDAGFVLVNFANADLVGHFGKYDPIIKACEVVDHELERLCNKLTNSGFICVITSDHGHADLVIDEATGQVMTSHTLNPVPFILYCPNSPELKMIRFDQSESNGLSKIAGTVLELMEIEKPSHDYESLIIK
jgi:2,3-bisphosphoglycerate-independent phosphoglycerate mutase